MKAFILLLLLPLSAYAGGRGPQGEPGQDGVNGIDGIDYSNFTPSLQHHFNPDSIKWQGSIAYDTIDSNDAYGIAIGKKVCGGCSSAFISGDIRKVEDRNGRKKTGYGVNVTFQW